MRIKELIRLLNELSEDSRVVVQGYEDGFDDVSTLHQIQIRVFHDPKWYYGKYEKNDTGGEPAVLLFGRPRGDI